MKRLFYILVALLLCSGCSPWNYERSTKSYVYQNEVSSDKKYKFPNTYIVDKDTESFRINTIYDKVRVKVIIDKNIVDLGEVACQNMYGDIYFNQEKEGLIIKTLRTKGGKVIIQNIDREGNYTSMIDTIPSFSR